MAGHIIRRRAKKDTTYMTSPFLDNVPDGVTRPVTSSIWSLAAPSAVLSFGSGLVVGGDGRLLILPLLARLSNTLSTSLDIVSSNDVSSGVLL